MNVIAIASVVSVVGAVVGVLLVHKLVGFRSVELPSGATETDRDPAIDSPGAGNLAEQVEQLNGLTLRLREEMHQREASDELRWRMLEESGEEVRQLRAMVRQLGYQLDKRLRDSDESRQRRERELERRQERELGRHRERELEQSRWDRQKERPLAPTR